MRNGASSALSCATRSSCASSRSAERPLATVSRGEWSVSAIAGAAKSETAASHGTRVEVEPAQVELRTLPWVFPWAALRGADRATRFQCSHALFRAEVEEGSGMGEIEGVCGGSRRRLLWFCGRGPGTGSQLSRLQHHHRG